VLGFGDALVIIFLDFEASSLWVGSYPVEVAWVSEDDTAAGYLIRPEPGWTEWDPKAEDIHGISHEVLMRDGDDAAAVARIVHAILRL